jgi:PhnB protein
MQIQPYLFFNGRCEEAADFYRRTIGAEEIMLMRWKDCPEPQQPGMVPPGSEDKVMHMALRIGDTTVLASDGPCQGQQSFQGFALSLTVPNEAEADRIRCSGRQRAGADAVGQNLLFSALRHGRRPLRRVMDGLCGGLTGAPRPARRAASWWI